MLTLPTENLGGVAVMPTQLAEMQASDTILHARDGRLEKVAVEKIRLPLDPQGHVQRLGLALAPDSTIYASQHTILSRSTDGGRTWEHLSRDLSQFGSRMLQVDAEGRLLNISQARGAGESPAVWASDDAGGTWKQIGQIDTAPFDEVEVGDCIARLLDGSLLVPLLHRAAEFGPDYGRLISGTNTAYVYRSQDGGHTFEQRSVLGDWCCEIHIAALPSGRTLATIRYQRHRLPQDPPDILERTGAAVFGSHFPYKHVFLADSTDDGATWEGFRQLTTVFGQCHGSAVGLSGDRVVVVHDHRYPRDMASGRAMVSRDGGQTWEDEVYYLCHGRAAGYARSITLDGEEMLTLVGSAYGDVEAWTNCIGKSHMVLIRWRLR